MDFLVKKHEVMKIPAFIPSFFLLNGENYLISKSPAKVKVHSTAFRGTEAPGNRANQWERSW